jgi:hypothetical protein
MEEALKTSMTVTMESASFGVIMSRLCRMKPRMDLVLDRRWLWRLS